MTKEYKCPDPWLVYNKPVLLKEAWTRCCSKEGLLQVHYLAEWKCYDSEPKVMFQLEFLGKDGVLVG